MFDAKRSSMNYPRSIEKLGSSEQAFSGATVSLGHRSTRTRSSSAVIAACQRSSTYIRAIISSLQSSRDAVMTTMMDLRRATRWTLFARLGSTRRICKSCLRYINKVLINTNEADAYDTCITIVLSVSRLASRFHASWTDGSAHSSWIAAVCKYICKSAMFYWYCREIIYHTRKLSARSGKGNEIKRRMTATFRV